MSAIEPADDRFSATDAAAGLLGAVAVALAGISIVYLPVRLAPIAIVLALVSARMSARFERLALKAVVAGGVAWVVGMTVAVLTENPLI